MKNMRNKQNAGTKNPCDLHPRISSLRIKNFKILQDVEFENLSPLTVFIGPNGGGKSTILDVFSFLSDSFKIGLRNAWNKHGRGKELKTHDSDGPITIEMVYEENGRSPITYHLSIDEKSGNPIVVEERVQLGQTNDESSPKLLECHEGVCQIINNGQPISSSLKSPDLLAVNALGLFEKYPIFSSLKNFITNWQIPDLSLDKMRSSIEAGPQERLSNTGDNLANVIQYLSEQHPKHLETILQELHKWMPHIEKVFTKIMADGRPLLQFKDSHFSVPIMAHHVSDGAINALAHLVILHSKPSPSLLCINKPENHLYPSVLAEFAEEFRKFSEQAQLFAVTHSPFLLNGLRPEEVWILQRNENGRIHANRLSNIDYVAHFVKQGALLGDLWLEGCLENNNRKLCKRL